MRRLAIALMVFGGLGVGLAIGSSGTSEAAMLIKVPHKNMSLVEEAKKNARRYSCTYIFCIRCCTDKVTGKETCLPYCR